MNYSKTSMKEYFTKFTMTPMRANIWDAVFVLSIMTTIYFLWKGPVSIGLQSVFVVVAVWYIKQLEIEISNRNKG